MLTMLTIDDTDLDLIISSTDWAEELAAATARYNSTPRWRFFRRHTHMQAIDSCLWFLTMQEAGRL